MRIVIALGGNALLPKGAKGTASEQRKAAKEALGRLSSLLRGHQVALTHGNGPQVGSLLLQQRGTSVVPRMPLDVLDAMTQGEIGYFIQGALGKGSAALLTRVVVDSRDQAFRNPTKPVGPFYKTRPSSAGRYVMDAGRGYRLVVPSPKAISIVEKDAILALLRSGFIVVCGGGGGIPVARDGTGLEAVIDKDDFSSLLASTIKADLLVFITSVSCVSLDFGKKTERPLGRASVAQMGRWLREGHFAEGSMKPKVEAAIRFIRRGGKKAVICSIEGIGSALSGGSGTVILP
ncbi:MAG: carbamate kinase [Candidatus Micrarchaeia archaeon]